MKRNYIISNTKYKELNIKLYVVGTSWNRLIEPILMSTHNIGFRRGLTDLESHHSLLCGALYTKHFMKISSMITQGKSLKITPVFCHTE